MSTPYKVAQAVLDNGMASSGYKQQTIIWGYADTVPYHHMAWHMASQCHNKFSYLIKPQI